MALGAFKISGAKLTTGGEYTLIIAQGFLETGTSLTAGDNFAKAIEKGGLKIASQGAAQALFSSSCVKTVFSKMPIPFNVFSVTSHEGVNVMQTDIADALLEKTAKKLTEKGIKAGLGAGLNASSAPVPANVQQRTTSAGLIDEVPIEQVLLLYLAIVHMEKGMGRGW